MTTLRPKNICRSCENINESSSLTTCRATGEAAPLHASHCVYYKGAEKPVDAVIVTAVPVELTAVLDHFSFGGRKDWSNQSFGEHPAQWWMLNMEVPGPGNVQLRVACAKAPKMGLPAAAALTTAAAHLFRPRFLVMPGITAGRRGKTNLGDIIVPDHVTDYGSGKWVEEIPAQSEAANGNTRFCPRPEPVTLEAQTLAVCELIKTENVIFDDIRRQWLDRNRTSTTNYGTPELIVGPTASGAAVVNSEQYWRDIISRNDKVVGIDMEAFGVAYAAEAVRTPLYHPSWLVAKSVCDFGVGKTKDHQEYAAYTSVRFVREFLIKSILNLSQHAPVMSNVA